MSYFNIRRPIGRLHYFLAMWGSNALASLVMNIAEKGFATAAPGPSLLIYFGALFTIMAFTFVLVLRRASDLEWAVTEKRLCVGLGFGFLVTMFLVGFFGVGVFDNAFAGTFVGVAIVAAVIANFYFGCRLLFVPGQLFRAKETAQIAIAVPAE